MKMRRSEAITRITNVLAVLPDSTTDQEKAAAILNMLEEFMYPAYQVEYGTGYADEYGSEITTIEWINRWEEE